MAQFPSKKVIASAIDLDADELRISDDKAKFIKNLTYLSDKNPNAQNGAGDNQGVLAPYAGNEMLSMFDLPIGNNYCIGTYEAKETNELYCFIYNSNTNHCIYRVNGNKTVQLVYKSPCLNFQYDSRYYISEGRCTLRVQLYVDFAGVKQQRKFLIFTDNFNDQRLISVEDSIATNSFDPIAHPYFARNGYYCSPCYLINLGLTTPMKCTGIETIPRDTDVEKSKQNLTVNKGWQIRIKHIDVFGRPSEHGIMSDRFFTVIGSNCTQTSNGLPRCYKLTVDAGCALIDKIQIEFRTSDTGQWFLYDTIEKYNNCADVPWWQRAITGALPYDVDNNTFAYTFCGDKECQPIDEAETTRLFNPLPRLSSGIMPINKGVGLSNNLRGFEPLDCSELDKINYTVTAPSAGCETTEFRKIVIYVPIYNFLKDKIVGLWKEDIQPREDAPIFWGFGDQYRSQNPKAWGQYFVPGNFGFNGYLAGTKYVTMSTQVELDLTTGQDRYIGFPILPIGTANGPLYDKGNKLICQKFEFNVPPGQYSFRIGSHLITQQDSYQGSSTNVFGVINLNDVSLFSLVNKDKELIINCCSGDVILNQPTDDTLVILDCTFGPYTSGNAYEDSESNLPLEYNPVIDNNGGTVIYTQFTDHNGFFFGVSGARSIDLSVQVNACQGVILNLINGSPTDSYHYDKYYAYKGAGSGDTYPIAGRRLVKGRVELCGTDIGIGGALIVSKNGPFTYTNSNGDYTLVLHQRPGGFGGDYVFMSQSGGCRLSQCNDPCAFCFTDYTVAYQVCEAPSRTTTLPTWDVAILGNVKGLRNGSRRSVGITMFDSQGRAGAIQSAEKHYINIPSLIDTKQFDFSTLGWTFDSGIKFPDWVKYVTFWITKDLSCDDKIMWVADTVQFIDNGGSVNISAPTKVRIYYGSLIAYNKQSNFATTTIWDITAADTSGDKVSVAGDYVEFIKNGDGTWFDKSVAALITYDKDGQYFDLEYTDELKDIKSGALYNLVRPKVCETQQLYYELCSTVRVVNGGPEAHSGILNAYDSYFINRQIPIPFINTDKDGKVTTTLNATWFSFFFEHHSPSDLWGYHLGNRGRINVKNPYEKEIRNGSEIDLSKALVDRSSYNGIGYFTGDTKEFEEQEWGNILVGLIEINQILFICEHNNFTVSFNDNTVTVSESGQVIAPSADNRFGNPQRKIGSDYGCQFSDINTIRKHKGLIFYLDKRRNVLLKHNYSDCGEISLLGYKNYLTTKIAKVNKENAIPGRAYDYMFVGGIDPERDEYYLTVFGRPTTEAIPQYLNIELDHSLQIRETIAVSMDSGLLKSFPSFVPEYYGMLEGYIDGKSMFSFRSARSWSHKVINPASPYNNFFGTQCKKVFTIVTNVDSEKVKRYMYTEVYCREHKMICDFIVTETKQQSRLLASFWKFAEKFWAAAFLRNVNTFVDPNLPILQSAPITEGDPLTGRWMKARYISEDADDNKYCEISSVNTVVIPVEKSGG